MDIPKKLLTMQKRLLSTNSIFVLFFTAASFGMENGQSVEDLFRAINNCNHKLLREELSNSTNQNSQLDRDLPLDLAICYRNYKAVKLLLKAGANCTACYNNKNGLFYFFMDSFVIDISNKKEIAILKAIVDAGCNVNTPLISRIKVMPLHKASIDNKTHIMQQLIEQGAQINAKTLYKATPLHLCILHAPDNDIDGVQLLIKAGAEVNIKASKGETPLRYAVNLNAPYIVKTLLSVPGIKTSILSKDGKSDLAVAKEKGHQEIGRLLIQHLGVYSAQGRISRRGFAQILPQEIAQHIATFLFRK